MTAVRQRKMLAYRPDDEVQAYIEQVKATNPDVSINQIVDALVRNSMKRLGTDVSITVQAEIVE